MAKQKLNKGQLKKIMNEIENGNIEAEVDESGGISLLGGNLACLLGIHAFVRGVCAVCGKRQ